MAYYCGQRRGLSGIVRRLVAEEDAQDLLEYALLGALVAAAGIGLLPIIQTGMGTAFGNWGSGVNSIWVPHAPLP